MRPSASRIATYSPFTRMHRSSSSYSIIMPAPFSSDPGFCSPGE
uniref:Uncharacterized protein n=1 Tax=Siphoviridae sp. ct0X023 TaxID=2825295 RepID=A0A8S5P250_9CAUD|nr:MAG TPA: hypothetical protein [Siphoviridae sp. ct0X023]